VGAAGGGDPRAEEVAGAVHRRELEDGLGCCLSYMSFTVIGLAALGAGVPVPRQQGLKVLRSRA
jgi:hypothetical protein